MHTVHELNIMSETSHADNILHHLWSINSGYTRTILDKIIRYACKAGYLNARACEGVTTYTLSVDRGGDCGCGGGDDCGASDSGCDCGCVGRRCVGCGERMGPFNPEEYTGVSSVRTKFIQRSTFVALVSNLNAFKKFVTESVVNAGG